jgi:hypothetical protein
MLNRKAISSPVLCLLLLGQLLLLMTPLGLAQRVPEPPVGGAQGAPAAGASAADPQAGVLVSPPAEAAPTPEVTGEMPAGLAVGLY